MHITHGFHIYSTVLLLYGFKSSQGLVFCPIITGKGIANELMSWKDSVVFTMALGGELCLPDLVNGKTLKQSAPNAIEVVDIRSIYDVEHMCSVFNQQCVPCRTVCNASCTHRILKRNEMNNILQYSRNMGHFLNSTQNNSGCVSNVLIKPGYLFFNIDVALYIQLQLQLRAPTWVRSMALENTKSMFPSDGNFVSIHWRFEETKCKRRLGSCVRSIFLSGRDNFMVSTDIIIKTITDFSQKFDAKVYIASDACLRLSCTLLDSVASQIGARTSKDLYEYVVRRRPGLQPWSIDFATIEQELCATGLAFMGSSVSSWSHEIYYKRAVASNDTKLLSLVLGLNNESKVQRQSIVHELKIIHATGSNLFFDLALLEHMPSQFIFEPIGASLKN